MKTKRVRSFFGLAIGAGVLAMSLPFPEARAGILERPDLFAHAVGSYALVFTGAEYLYRPPALIEPFETANALMLSAGVTLGLGLAKEFLIDQKPDSTDIIADLVGILLGSAAFLCLEF